MTSNNRTKITMTVLTPVSIGAGSDKDWIYGLDYILKDGNIYVIDLRKAVANGVPIKDLTAALQSQDSKAIRQILEDRLETIVKSDDYIFPAPLTDSKAYASPIKTFIRTCGQPYVPGTSLKGAIRSALTNYLIGQQNVDYRSGRFTTKVYSERTHQNKDVDVYGSVTDGEDIMRFIQVGDMKLHATQLLNTNVFNLQGVSQNWKGGWKHADNFTSDNFKDAGFNTIYECAVPGSQATGSITFNTNAFAILPHKEQMVSMPQKEQLMDDTRGLPTLFSIINRQTLEYLKEELRFFQTFPTERTVEIEQCIQDLIEATENSAPSSCIIKMSAGSGYHSISGNWRDKDFTKDHAHQVKKNGEQMEIPFKSRKIVTCEGRLQLMGFVKLQA